MERIRCEFCGSERCARILYGRVAENKQLREDLEVGKVVLGGCLVYGEMPQWRCLDCGAEWGRSREAHEGAR